ncbi:MAG: hypothetical protein LBH11_00380, partial [Propionibacteriaceae bacterium]|nr:hypothetical protein [Propionibacteriaceae bacterium]
MKLPGMIWRDGEFVAEQVAVDGLAELVAAPDQLSWIDLRHPAVEQLAALGKELGFDAHTIEDALSPRERPKTVRYSGYTFSLVAAANLGVKKASGSRLHLSYLGVYSIGGCLITVQQGAPFDMQPVVERWRDDRDLVAFGVDGLLQAVLDVVVDQYTAVLQKLDEELDGVADQLFVANPDSKGLQQQAFSIRRELSELRRIITPMREAVATLIHNGQGAKN